MKDSTGFLSSLIRNRFWTQRARWLVRLLTAPDLVSRSRKFWRENQGQFAGRRGFVIGNGPSLKTADLERLSDEVTIASNRIYLAYPETRWRSTIHTCGDRLIWEKFAGEICTQANRVVITSNLSPRRGKRSKLVYSWNFGPSTRAAHGFSLNQCRGSYIGWTITYTNLQIAAHLGLNPIYLIGCDHYYGEAQHNSRGSDVTGVVHRGPSYHFHKDYRRPGEVVFSAPVQLMNDAFAIAHRESLANGIQIFNATRGGFLEVFPRADLDQVLLGSPCISALTGSE